ncbi:hypothetical protein [Nocardioides sp. 503]|uniref:hypothetical protein n=1 Tax=Nocardioides sp. 503 TaxID=2508326 RepID=UPI00106FB34F|nr:hypothetical protein [Nocardioides sp. 503]
MSSHDPVRDPVDAVARQLLGALVCALALSLPLHGALGATSKRDLLLWLLAAALLAGAVGLLLRLIDVPRAVGTALAAGGVFGAAATVAVTVVALLGLPDGDAELSLLAGVPAAAVAALATPVIQRRSGSDEGVALSAGMMGLVAVLVASWPLGGLLDGARDDVAEIRVLEATGLTSYLPKIDGMRAEYTGATSYDMPQAGVRPRPDGYHLTYRDESVESPSFSDASLDVEVRWVDGAPCDSAGIYTCTEGSGYVVVSRDGQPEAVVVDRDDIRLVATIEEGDGDLPEPDDVGRALLDAKTVGWQEIVDLTDD